MTVRQIYYQLVARGHVENTVRSYDNVQALINNARLAGLLDWDSMEDRERVLVDRGVLQGYVLSSYSARKLNMRTTGHAGGSGCGVHRSRWPVVAGTRP